MKFFATLSSVVAVAQLALAQSGAQINTPSSLTTCVPVQLTWSGGASPYFISILPGGQTSGALYQFPQQTGNSLTWTTNYPAGTALTFSITDGSGVTNYSDQVTIAAGSNTSCVGQSAAVSGGSTAAAAGGASTAAQATGSGSRTSAASGNSPTTAGTSSPAQSSQPANSGSALKISGAAALFGAAVVAAL